MRRSVGLACADSYWARLLEAATPLSKACWMWVKNASVNENTCTSSRERRGSRPLAFAAFQAGSLGISEDTRGAMDILPTGGLPAAIARCRSSARAVSQVSEGISAILQ